MTSTVCPPAASFFGFMGAASALIFSNLGAAYGTAKSGVGVASMGVMRPELVMRCIIPVVMAGVLGCVWGGGGGGAWTGAVEGGGGVEVDTSLLTAGCLSWGDPVLAWIYCQWGQRVNVPLGAVALGRMPVSAACGWPGRLWGQPVVVPARCSSRVLTCVYL